jgi:hypothetical protein
MAKKYRVEAAKLDGGRKPDIGPPTGISQKRLGRELINAWADFRLRPSSPAREMEVRSPLLYYDWSRTPIIVRKRKRGTEPRSGCHVSDS